MAAKALSKKQIADVIAILHESHDAFKAGLSNMLRRGYEFGLSSGTSVEGAHVILSRDMTPQDEATVEAALEHVETHVDGITADYVQKFRLALSEANKHIRRANRHQTSVSEGQTHSEQVREIVAKLRKASQDAKRDWERVAITELNNLVQEGRAAAIEKKTKSSDARVYKRPRSTACVYCKLLYLEKDGVTPRVFRLSALVANGSNIGRAANRPTLKGPAATEWRPTLDSVHPNCQCMLHILPDGYGFKDGQLVQKTLQKSDHEDEAVVEELSPFDRLLINHTCVK